MSNPRFSKRMSRILLEELEKLAIEDGETRAKYVEQVLWEHVRRIRRERMMGLPAQPSKPTGFVAFGN